MGTWTRIAVVSALSVATLAVTAVLASPSGASVNPPPNPTAVRVATVQAAPTSRIARLHGLTRARERSLLAFTAPGRLVQREVDVGDRVEAGQVLARIDRAPLAHRVSQANAQLRDLTARLEQVASDRARLQQLDADNAVAPAERERIESQERSLQAAVDQSRVALDEAQRQQREGVLRAPYAAEVVAVMAQPGETLGAGAPVLSLAGVGLEVVVEAPEPVWVGVSPSNPASVHLPGIGCTEVPARVSRVSRAASGSGQLFPVHVDLDPDSPCDLVPGLTARVDLQLPVTPAMAVPVRAILDPTGSGAAVLRLRQDRVERIAVTPVRLDGDRVAITGELELGDEVVIGGMLGLVDGQRVEVVR